MKHIRFFSSVLLVAIISVAIAAFACENLKAIRDAARQIRDEARQKHEDLIRTSLALLTPLTMVPPPVIQVNPLLMIFRPDSLQVLSPKNLTQRLLLPNQNWIKPRSPLTLHSTNSINV